MVFAIVYCFMLTMIVSFLVCKIHEEWTKLSVNLLDKMLNTFIQWNEHGNGDRG